MNDLIIIIKPLNYWGFYFKIKALLSESLIDFALVKENFAQIFSEID